MSVSILIGDAREKLREMPDQSVHCCVTSPPYFGLRDYGCDGQMGLEPTPDEYVAGMVALFREVRRVLRDDGTLWLNIGDSYASTTKGGGGTAKSGLRAPRNDDGSLAAHGASFQAQYFGERRFDLDACGVKQKDLIGIPWMLAFALRAPDYLGRIRNEADRAWLAGLIDGEGCVSILETKSGHGSGESYPPILQVRMCDPECIEKAMALVGSESENPAQYPPSMEGQRPAYQWRIHGRKAADTLAEIYPFLLIKRKQAIVAWNHQAVRDSYETKRGVKIPAAALEKQKLCRELIQKLNRRDPVDLPSWMIEPPLPVGPGWYLRQDVIWSKPNPMPESVRDRCTKAHEYMFLLSKGPRYYYDAEAVAEPALQSGGGEIASPDKAARAGITTNGMGATSLRCKPETRNKRSVWEVATQPFSEAHFATYPPELIEPCIKAGCPDRCCAKCGAPVERVVTKGEPNEEWKARCGADKSGGYNGNGKDDPSGKAQNPSDLKRRILEGMRHKEHSFQATCDCGAGFVAGTVLDPFGGAGTTGLVADRLGRDAILVELNPEYASIAERRLNADAPLFAEVKAA